MGGCASNNKYSLLGGLRAAAQMISYELPLGMAIASVVLFVGSLSVVDIAAAQENWWFIFLNPIGGIIFIIAVLDRKSTRLNSSHVAISYAVFCLKKKK